MGFMKTRKEQIDEMANIIKADYKQWLDITGVFPEGSSYYFECLGGGEDCAELLYNAGYGDVSEYKAKIERLKEETSNIRKDTAEEFATRICGMLWNLVIDKDGNRFGYGYLTSENVLYVAKQFGVDIDDRLCKKNDIATSHINKLVEQDVEIKKLKQQVKQAKIDVLNKLKKYLHTEDFDTPDERWKPESEFCEIIDKIINEVQNAEDKG